MVLVTSLLLLVVVTVLAIAMFRSFGIDEKIAGNVREKTRALGAAETAEQYAEYWLAQGNGGTGVTCTTTPVPFTTGQICSQALDPAAAATLQWPGFVAYSPVTPTPMVLMSNNAVTDKSNSYFAAPYFYIRYLGLQPGGLGSIYQIDAAGFGGSANSVAVVETTYLVQTKVKDLGAL